MPPVQPMSSGQPVPVMVQQVQPVAASQKGTSGLIKTIVIVILSLVCVTFIGLFIWMSMQYKSASEDVESKVSEAVAVAKDTQESKDQEECEISKKEPYQLFAGPVDYGELSFLYPKTWSVYVASDASKGGDYYAYFNPRQVNAVSEDTINALRVSILNKSYEDMVAQYQKDVEKKDSGLSAEVITIGDAEAGIQVTANKYSGNIPKTDLRGFIVLFKIRDKTVVMRTDSELFEKDFNDILNTIVFNE